MDYTNAVSSANGCSGQRKLSKKKQNKTKQNVSATVLFLEAVHCSVLLLLTGLGSRENTASCFCAGIQLFRERLSNKLKPEAATMSKGIMVNGGSWSLIET